MLGRSPKVNVKRSVKISASFLLKNLLLTFLMLRNIVSISLSLSLLSLSVNYSNSRVFYLSESIKMGGARMGRIHLSQL